MTTKEDCLKLKQFGFKWYKNQSTDAVSDDCIEDVVPAANGFTVIYNDKSVLAASTAEVEKIDFPDDLANKWTLVHWKSITDERRVEA